MKSVVMLIPSCTSTKTFHKYIWDGNNHCPRPGVQIRFLDARPKFAGINSKGVYVDDSTGTRDCMIVIFRKP